MTARSSPQGYPVSALYSFETTKDAQGGNAKTISPLMMPMASTLTCSEDARQLSIRASARHAWRRVSGLLWALLHKVLECHVTGLGGG